VITRQHNETSLFEVHGQSMQEFLASEYYYENKKVSDASLLFVRFTESGWHRFYLDAGILFWQQVEAVDLDELVGKSGPDEFRCVDIADSHNLCGQELISSEMGQVILEGANAGCFTMQFGNGATLKLTHIYNNTSDHEFSERTILQIENA